MSKQYDLIILGGGCAGLSLAGELARYGGTAPRTLILDKRPSYQNDRTWCFWELPGSAASNLVGHRWREFTVVSRKLTVHVDCFATPYCAISSDRFYRQSLSQLAASPAIELLTGVNALGEIRPLGSGWEVRTDRGPLAADMVVDTRPLRQPTNGDALLWQIFFGAEVEFYAPCLDPGVVTLMDFRMSPQGRIVFTYLLPFSSRHGLVEVTEFSPLAYPPTALQPLLQSVLRDLAEGARYETRRTEGGSLPMGLARAGTPRTFTFRRPLTCVRAGVFAGGARPATGYAFQRIQRWAVRCAASIMRRSHPVAHPADPPHLTFLDHLFLRVLRRHPDRAPGLFTQLFGGAPTPSVLRFLGDQPSAADIGQVIRALPAGIFLRELFSRSGEGAAQWRESPVA